MRNVEERILQKYVPGIEREMSERRRSMMQHVLFFLYRRGKRISVLHVIRLGKKGKGGSVNIRMRQGNKYVPDMPVPVEFSW